MTRICDYEGSQYRTNFWQGQNREYENRVERIAMQKLLPPYGSRLIEVGAGFGRLADLYQGYDEVILTDYARTQLEQARDYLYDDRRFKFVVADVYNMPFVGNLFDALTMVRVMHHLVDVPVALSELYRLIAPNGTAVIEHASKFHLKSLVRWALRRQDWSPFDPDPHEFVELNFDFYPPWIRQKFRDAGFRVTNIRTLSHFRLDLLKRLVPTSWLVMLDSLAQPTGNWFQLTPSVFLQAQVKKPASTFPTDFFRCPICHSSAFARQNSPSKTVNSELLICETCRHGWSFQDGIYDFKTPVKVV